MAEGDEVTSRVREELEASRAEFHELLAAVTPDRWDRRSNNPGWTNGQLLFHIALGFFLVVPLVIVMRVFAVLPRGASRIFALGLNAMTPLFNWINGIGPRFGAKVLTRNRLGVVFDSVHRLILRKVEAMRSSDWSRGMHYPTKWEPRFADFMTFQALFLYPIVHLRHHRNQLVVSLAICLVVFGCSRRTNEEPFRDAAVATVSAETTSANPGVRDLTDATFESAIANDQSLVVVVFWAPWSGPDRVLLNVLPDVIRTFPTQITVYRLNVDENPQATRKHGINSIPTTIVFRRGAVVEKAVGAMPADAVIRLIKPHL